jgi:hypothetical protein
MWQNLRLCDYPSESYRFIISNFVLRLVWRYAISIDKDIAMEHCMSILKRKLSGKSSNCTNTKQNKEVVTDR